MIVLLCITLVLFFITSIIVHEGLPVNVWMLLSGVIVLVTTYPFILKKLAEKEYKTNSRLKEVQTYELSEAEVKITAESFQSTFTWDKLYKISQNKKYIFLWQSQNSAHILPKREMTDEAIEFLLRKKNTLKVS